MPTTRALLVSGRNVQATGVDRYAREIAKALRAAGVDVKERVRQRREWRIMGRPVGGLASLWLQGLRRQPREGADLVHALDTSVASRGCDVVTVQDILPEQFPRWFLRTASQRLDWRLTRRATTRVPIVLSASEATAELLVERWGIERERIVVAHHGIDNKDFHRVNEPSPLVADKGRTFVYVGDDNPRKNLLRAVEGLARIGEPARLVRCGPSRFPDVREAYHAAAKEGGVEIVEAGYVDDAQLRALLSNADAFVWPTLGEGFGFPPLEAMACGCPVVALSTPVNEEICGPLASYHADDAADVATAVRRLLDHPPSTSAIEAYAATFTWERAAQRTLVAYELAVTG